MDFDRKYCPECYSLLGEGDYDYVTGHSDYICGCCGWKGTDRTALSCEKKVLLCMKDLLEETFTDEAVKKLMPIIRDDVFDYMKRQ